MKDLRFRLNLFLPEGLEFGGSGLRVMLGFRALGLMGFRISEGRCLQHLLGVD